MKLKEWQHHIRQTHADRKHLAWCGEQLEPVTWAYVNIDHAAYSAPRDRIQPCPACVAAIAVALRGN
mgnify:FL=1